MFILNAFEMWDVKGEHIKIKRNMDKEFHQRLTDKLQKVTLRIIFHSFLLTYIIIMCKVRILSRLAQ